MKNGENTSSIIPKNFVQHESISVESEQPVIFVFNEVNFCAVMAGLIVLKIHVLNHYSKYAFQIQTQNFRIARFAADKSQIQTKVQSNNGLTKCLVPELQNA